MDNESVLADCKKVLANNQRGNYTIPAGGLYPHQWLWDSCFIAIGLSNYDIDRAQKELLSLLRGQWANGMIPNMIFAEGDEHKRDRNMWQSKRSSYSPDDIATSGITQPPMLAEAIFCIGKKLKLPERRVWYQTVYPAVLAYHEWLYKERDPHEEGLVLLIHPWESGLDNSPPWINQLMMHHKPWWIGLIENTRVDKIIDLIRRDTMYVPPGERISDTEALLYYDVVRRLKRKNWDIEKILTRSHFVVQDLAFNCILIRAHDHLRNIAKTIGHEVPDWLNERVHLGRQAVTDKLWDPFSGQFYSRNFVTHKLIKEPSLATLFPIYAGLTNEAQTLSLIKLIKSRDNFGTNYPIPSVPVSYSWYKEFGYWQGPTWINTNWLIIDGLNRIGHTKEADHIKAKTIELVKNNGPFEYFSAKTGEPAGAKNFSWSAALAIDLISKK
ncbi:MAG: trehalase family glycosidase [bacterium]